MDNIGYLRDVDGRVEFHYEKLGLVIRGNYTEWVLEAAAEIIAQTEKMEAEGRISELETLSEFGEANEIEVDSAKHEANNRFELMPQCTVSMGALDYRWVAGQGREATGEDFGGNPMRRIHDMSMTRNDTFLKNEDGIDTSGS